MVLATSAALSCDSIADEGTLIPEAINPVKATTVTFHCTRFPMTKSPIFFRCRNAAIPRKTKAEHSALVLTTKQAIQILATFANKRASVGLMMSSQDNLLPVLRLKKPQMFLEKTSSKEDY